MILFLTSSPTGPLDQSYFVDGFDHKNHFVDNLKRYWKEHSHCAIISAAPHSYNKNDEMTDFFKGVLKKENFSYDTFDLYDYRYPLESDKLQQYDVLFLAGGHVPTQNQYFQEIQLKEKLQNYNGIIIGISAGSMNCSQLVYALPEEENEAINPHYQRWLLGLGLTSYHVIPHYQMIKNNRIDGLDLFLDIVYKDSFRCPFYLLEDGSYLLINEKITLYGKSYYLDKGQLSLLIENDEYIELEKEK